MRYVIIVLWMLLCSITSAVAQVSVSIGLPGMSIGINLPVYPQLVRVPGYPVYYAPQVNSNYFFYDGMYWVYQQDNWYASSWYNGPWELVRPDLVPLFVLRVPVRYYRHPPDYFRGWQADAPPRWNEHWGSDWERSHSGWNTWNRSAVPAPAPLPSYQRQYSGNRYPRAEQQQTLQSQHYHYQPRDAVVQQHYQAQRMQSAPASAPAQDQRGTSRPSSPRQGASPAPRGQVPQTGGTNVQRPAAVPAPPQQASPPAPQPQQPRQGAAQREKQTARPPQGQVQRPAPVQAPPQQSGPAAQQQMQQPPQGATQRDKQTPRPQGQVQRPAAMPAPSQQQASPPARQPPQGAAQRAQQPPKAQGQDKGPRGKGSAQEPKQGDEKGHDKGS